MRRLPHRLGAPILFFHFWFWPRRCFGLLVGGYSRMPPDYVAKYALAQFGKLPSADFPSIVAFHVGVFSQVFRDKIDCFALVVGQGCVWSGFGIFGLEREQVLPLGWHELAAEVEKVIPIYFH